MKQFNANLEGLFLLFVRKNQSKTKPFYHTLQQVVFNTKSWGDKKN